LKKLFFVLLTTVSLFAAWEPLSERHLSMSKTQNKPIAVYLYKAGCPHCQHFQQTTLQNKRVQNLFHNRFIATSLNVGEIKSPFAFTITPTIVFIDSMGRVIADSVEGDVTPSMLTPYLEALVNAY